MLTKSDQQILSQSSSTDVADTIITRAPNVVYLVGAPAAGKTTLTEALSDHFRLQGSLRSFSVISEVARELVLREQVDPKDIQLGREVGMDLQRQILEEQKLREENAAQANELTLCDRSGLDPIVFATRYGKKLYRQQLLSSSAWCYLKRRMQHGLVILCEPVLEWFMTDGVRIDAGSTTEQAELHALFVQLLQSEVIPYKVLPAAMTKCEERVDFVLAALRGLEERGCADHS